MLFGGDGTHCFARKTRRDYEKEKPSPFLKKVLRQSQLSTSEHDPKKVKLIWNKRIRFLLADDLSDIFTFQIILFNLNLQSYATQLIINSQKIMIFSISNDGIQRWTFAFAPDSVTTAVIDLIQKNINQLTSNTPSCLAITVVSKASFPG